MYGWSGNDTIIGNGGNDTVYGGLGSDMLLLNMLKSTGATISNGLTTWKDFTLGDVNSNLQADKIDLSNLLVDYTGDKSATSLLPYITTTNQNGNTMIFVDADGAADAYSSTLVLTLNNTTTNFNDLMANHQIII